ncbi:hypothetical protein ACXIZN_04180 [Amycolatopsis sp. TRM77291]
MARLADVPALAYVSAETAPGLFEGVEDLVLGHRLVDAALQDPLSAAARDRDRLVRGEQRHVVSLEFALDRQAFEGPSGDACDVLADDDVEPAFRAGGLGQKVGDAAVAGDRDIEPFVVLASSAGSEVHASRLDVVEVRDDHP